jgi:hypothetical protein
VVAFNEDASFHRDSCNKLNNKKLIEKALKEVFRSRFRLRCISDPSPEGKKERPAESQEEREKKETVEKLLKDPIVKKAMEVFRVKVIDINEEDNS